MIKKRLFSLVKGSGGYILLNVLWQWLTLLSSVAAAFTTGRIVAEALNGAELIRPFEMGVIAVSLLFRGMAVKMAARASGRASEDVKKSLRLKLYEKLLSLGPGYHEQISTAAAVQVAVEGIEQLEVYFGSYLPQLLYSIIAPITLFFVLLPVSRTASTVLLICVPLIPISIVLVQKFAKRLLKKYWGRYTSLGSTFLENLQGLTTLKIYKADEMKAERMNEEAGRFRKITMRVLLMQINSIIVMDFIAYGGAALGILLGLKAYHDGRCDMAGALTLILLSAEFFLPMRRLGSLFHIAMNGMAASDRLFEILDLVPKGNGHLDVPDGDAHIIFKDVNFSYEPEREILRDISLCLKENSITAVVGASGSGKSTVAGILSGKNTGYLGSILWNGRELSDISHESLAKHITLVGCNSYIFGGTLESNLRMAAPKVSEYRLWEALDAVNLGDWARDNDGLSTPIKERGENLSGGQRQRLALARAVLHDTHVYIFDEATSNIDKESEEAIMDAITALSKTKTVLLISHRLLNVTDADRIYVLNDHEICEAGSHMELLRKSGIYAALFYKQQELENYGRRDHSVTCIEQNFQNDISVKRERRVHYA